MLGPSPGSGAHRHGGGGGGDGPARGPYPSMKELQNMAACLDLGEDVSLNELLRIAEDSIEKSKGFAQQKIYDAALVNYLKASDITVNTIPRHPDYSYMKQHHPRWADQFTRLMTVVDSQHAVMGEIKRIITAENNNSAVNGHNSRTPESSYSREFTPESPLRMPSPSNFQTIPSSHPARPEVKPKPASLTRRPTSDIPAAQDPLTLRFTELRNRRHNRMSVTSESSTPVSSTHGNGNYSPTRQRPQSQPFSNHLPDYSTSPFGPRDQTSHSVPPHIPPKLPIPPDDSQLPRYPSPAYSPIWSVPSPGPLIPPRTSVESSRSMAYTKQPPARVGIGGYDNATADNPYRSQTPNGIRTETEARNRTSELSCGATISAEKLMNYLHKFDILLVDVRSRTAFDTGHIYHRSIMCIEPVVLRENVSAEELEDRLIISPEAEQALFSRRNEFDLIVYYDQSTVEPSYLVGSPAGSSMPHLRALYDTLYEFNMYKPLKDGRPPALLAGGLDAWIDLVGPQSLATSHTAAILSSVRARKPIPERPVQPLRRFPTASANSSWEVKKRRLREHKPLNAEEERDWLEKARREEIETNYIAEDGTMIEEPEEYETSQSQPASPFVRSYEDFLNRFPEPQNIRQSMASPENSNQFDTYDLPAVAPPSRPPPAIPRPSYSGVADRVPLQPPLARQSSAHRQPLYSSPLDRLKLPRTGLVNLGSTCYMNSIIQSLSATVLLTKFFVDNRFHACVQKNYKGSQGVLPGLYSNLIRSLWKNDVEVIRPTTFRKFIGRLNPEWAKSEQQDAKEFFDVLVDCLHEDLNQRWQRSPLVPLTFEQEMYRENMPIPKVSEIEWDRYCHRESSYISSLFAGQHASILRCTTCRKTSTTYEAFYSISVEIPPSGTGDIYQCLRSYCQEEILSGYDEWKCPYCKREREATKQIILTRAPKVLVVHFKRFSASQRQQARKIHTQVSFPLKGLDIGPFMHPSSQAPHSNSPSRTPHNDTQNPKSLPSNPSTAGAAALDPARPPYIYNAYAVVRHLGSTIHEGHYIALAKDTTRDCWRKFDDQRVMDFQPSSSRSSADNLQNEQAYLVFYERT
ncbi:ubiquitin-specific protease doa4 [Myotisia sp. PD_48]|nr:ubiquitin-specific protease doa4 [Myotisia sp. PD_48]